MTSQIEQLLKEKFAEVEYDPARKLLTAKWIGFLNMEQVQKVVDVLSRAVKKHQVQLHLSDQSQMKVLTKEIQQQVGTKVLPELQNLGLRKMAVFASEDVFAQAAAQSVHTIYIGQLAIHTFNSKAKCEEWLTQK
jgi:hypothetical protein